MWGDLKNIIRKNLLNPEQDTRLLWYIEKTNDIGDVIGVYIMEIWNFEQRMYGGDSLEIVEELLKEEKTTEELVELLMSTHKLDSDNARIQLHKLINIKNTYQDFMLLDFSIDTIKHIHSQLMDGLLPERLLGRYRKVDVKPYGSWYTYLPYNDIEYRLTILVDVVQKEMAKTTSKTNAIIIASIFLEQFLNIHPFINGNGRCVRFLFSLLLKPYFNFPICIHKHIYKSYETCRLDYLNSLEMSRISTDHSPIIDYIREGICSFLLIII